MSTSIDTTAQSLAEFAHGLTLAAVPAATQQRALHLMLDAIGCALAARQEDFALKLAPAIASLADTEGHRGVIGFAQRLPLRDATGSTACSRMAWTTTTRTWPVSCT